MEEPKPGRKGKLAELKKRAKELRNETMALYIACRRKDVPLCARVIGIAVIGYAMSPIDLIPDFIPVLGYIDDLFIIPAGILLVRKMIPQNIMEECRAQAEETFRYKSPRSNAAGAVIIIIWAALIGFILFKIYKWIRH